MLTREMVEIMGPQAETNCDYFGGDAAIQMHGYGDSENGDCNWCADCAMQLARKILEDLCELLTKGGRHG